mmetsp:Transcript_64604/g.192463  ORF Transcript_64604/g.192463 Transcript_64604/m.192463 type:complete len:230 (-) Transcript_64604:1657-2346(-)
MHLPAHLRRVGEEAGWRVGARPSHTSEPPRLDSPPPRCVCPHGVHTGISLSRAHRRLRNRLQRLGIPAFLCVQTPHDALHSSLRRYHALHDLLLMEAENFHGLDALLDGSYGQQRSDYVPLVCTATELQKALHKFVDLQSAILICVQDLEETLTVGHTDVQVIQQQPHLRLLEHLEECGVADLEVEIRQRPRAVPQRDLLHDRSCRSRGEEVPEPLVALLPEPRCLSQL